MPDLVKFVCQVLIPAEWSITNPPQSVVCGRDSAGILQIKVSPDCQVWVHACEKHGSAITQHQKMNDSVYRAGYWAGRRGDVVFATLVTNPLYMDGYIVGEAERKDLEGRSDRMDNVLNERDQTHSMET